MIYCLLNKKPTTLCIFFHLLDHDGAEPSVNSVSCGNLIILSRLLSRTDFEDKASSILKLFFERLMKVPASLPEMSVALLMYLNPAEQVCTYRLIISLCCVPLIYFVFCHELFFFLPPI